MTFGGEKKTIYKDPPSNDTYAAPEWLDDPMQGIHRAYPVCYVRNSKISASATFRIKPTSSSKTVSIAARATYTFNGVEFNFNFPSRSVVFSNGSGLYPMSEAPTELPDTVEWVENFKIIWFVSSGSGGGSGSGSIGSSENPMYVVLGSPTAFTLWRTLLHVGCKPASGESTASGTVGKLWGDFQGKVVKTWDDQPVNGMDYWGFLASGCADVECLLDRKDAQCGGWGKFLVEVLAAQGISSTFKAVYPNENAAGLPSGLTPTSLLVPNADVSGIPNQTYTTLGFTALGSVAGQGGTPIAQNFMDHALVLYNSKYYDPSYGAGPFNSLVEWQRSGLKAVIFQDNILAKLYYCLNTGSGWGQFVRDV